MYRQNRLANRQGEPVNQKGGQKMTTQISCTTPAQRAVLAQHGFVRVDGLEATRTTYDPINGAIRVAGGVIGHDDDERPARWRGRWDYNKSKFVIRTSTKFGCEVWLRSGYPELFEDGNEELHDIGFPNELHQLLREIAPYGKGCNVPLSNGEGVHWAHLLRRLAEPDWDPKS